MDTNFNKINILSIFFFICFTALVYFNNTYLFYFINYLGSFFPSTFWIILTEFGNAYILLGLLSVLFIRYPVLTTRVIIAMLISTIIVRLGKQFFGVIRPPGVLSLDTFNLIGNPITLNSFPSGHATTISSFIGIFFLSANLKVMSKFFLVIFLLFTCISRITIGVHWPFDVLIGIYTGFLSSYLVIKYIPIANTLSKNLLFNIFVIFVFAFSLLGLVTGRGSYYLQSSYMFIILGYLFILLILIQLFYLYKSKSKRVSEK